jgi:DNA-binding transcriptional MocR family regulator
VAWVILEEVTLQAVDEDGRLVAHTSARQLAHRLGVDPGTAGKALGALRRQGLLRLEREHGPAGRFGLSVYVLGEVAGLTVVRPGPVAPWVAPPSPEKASPDDSDPAAVTPAQPWAERPRAAAPQCPGQTALNFGTVSS